MSMGSKYFLELEIRESYKSIARTKIAIASCEAWKEQKAAWMAFNEKSAADIEAKMLQFDQKITNLGAELTKDQGELELQLTEYKGKQE